MFLVLLGPAVSVGGDVKPQRTRNSNVPLQSVDMQGHNIQESSQFNPCTCQNKAVAAMNVLAESLPAPRLSTNSR